MVPTPIPTHAASAALNHSPSGIPTATADQSNIPDPSIANSNGAVNHHAPSSHVVSPETVAFYSVGPNEAPIATPSVNLDPNMSMDSANLFEDLPKYLQGVGGSSSAAGMLAAQVQVTQATLGWSLVGQMASKVSSGIQSLFNNQV